MQPGSILFPAVQAFAQALNSSARPVVLKYQNLNYASDQCHLSAKHAALTKGGRRVHGWAIWQDTVYTFAEFHSVWEMPDTTLVDITPPKFSASQILFIRDFKESIISNGCNYELPTDRSTDPNNPCYLFGKPTHYTHWPLSPSAPALVSYCQTLNMPVSQILTDPTHG
jgi:hypothetical protein